MMRRGVGDRRSKPRFEIVGELGGSLETMVVLTLRNVSRGGVLVESPVSLPIGTRHRVRLQCDAFQAPGQVVVRHVRAATAIGETRFLVGFEFVALTPELQDVVDRWLLRHGETTT